MGGSSDKEEQGRMSSKDEKLDAEAWESSVPWILGFLVGLMGITALFVSAGAENSFAYWDGLAFFAFAVGLIMYQVKRAFDRAEAARRETGGDHKASAAHH
jgi:hypothetical protein